MKNAQDRVSVIRRRGRMVAVLAFAAALGARGAAAQQTVDFVFVAPAATIDTNFPGAALTGAPAPAFTAAWATLPTGYKGVLITAANLATFQAQAPPRIRHLHAQLQPGAALRNSLDRVLTISGGRADIRFFLIDDRSNVDAGRGLFWSVPMGSPAHHFVWPAANSLPITGTARHQGIVGLGERWGDWWVSNVPGGLTAWEAVALHEGSHTQWVGDFSRWGALNQEWLAYGQGGHYNEEILGDQEAPHNEGMGTFFGRMHNNAEWTRQVTTFFNNADLRYFVDAQSIPAGWEELYRVAARRPDRMSTLNSNIVPNSANDFAIWRYRWLDVPSFYLLFSESTPTAFYVFFWQNVNGDRNQALQMILNFAADAWDNRRRRFLLYTANHLALQMETWAATPAGQTARTAGTATSSMFPYALVDVLTHCGFSDADYQAEIRREHPPRTSRAATEYFNHRAALCTRVRPMLTASPVRIEDAVREAATYFRQAATILTPAAGPGPGVTP